MMKRIDMTNMHLRRPIRSATKGVIIEPRILPAVGMPLPVICQNNFDGSSSQAYQTTPEEQKLRMYSSSGYTLQSGT